MEEIVTVARYGFESLRSLPAVLQNERGFHHINQFVAKFEAVGGCDTPAAMTRMLEPVFGFRIGLGWRRAWCEEPGVKNLV